MDHVVPAQNLITTSEQLDALVEDYSNLEAFAFDVETTGDNRLNPRRAQMLWLCLATTGRCDVIPMGHPHGDLISERPAPVLTGRRKLDKGKTYEELRPSDLSRSVMERVWTPAPVQLSHTEVFTALRSVFMSDATKVGQNVKFDLHSVGQYLGELPAPPYFDTHIATWLLDVSKKGGRSLDDLTRQFLGYDMTKGVGENVVEYGFNTVAAYSYLDGRYTWLLYQHLIERFAALSPDTQKLLALEMEVLEPTMMMESSGVRIDVGILGSLDMLFRDNIEAAKAMCMYQAGRTFNLNSPKDKQELLFKPKSSGGQGLRIHKLTASGEKRVSAGEKPTIYDASTDAESLAYYPHNELVAQMQTYASFTKLLGTYVTPYLGGEKVSTTNGKSKVEEVPSQLDGGRIYGRFNQTGAESGRYSSSAPNLQNIPNRTEEGKKLRSVFVPDKGHVLICADYSQIEPRIIASLAKDKTMLQVYRDGGDVYQAVADRLSGPTSGHQITRAVGKELVLSIAYGIGPESIGARTGLTMREAKELMEYFTSHFRSIPAHKNAVIAQARRRRYAETMFGRRRPLPGLFWNKPGERSKAERQAYNHTIQGSAADLMKFALVKVYDALLDWPEARLLLTVHDEVVITAPKAEAEQIAASVKEQMESIGKSRLAVPLVADVGMGLSWADAKH